MSPGASLLGRAGGPVPAATRTEPLWARVGLIAVAGGFMGLFLLVPLAAVFFNAFQKGGGAFVAAVTDPLTLSAVRLTLITALATVPINLMFGVAAAWAITRFRFPGKNVLLTLIDLPFSVSPVIAGMVFVLLFGAQGWFGPWLAERGWRILFSPLGIVISTLFVTSPYIARELIPLLQALGTDEEEAAYVLGAGGFQMFWRVTLPKIKWGLLYGVILCTARSMGEFGAVSVVSGHISGRTNTLPLHVEALHNEYNFSGAFAVASLLVLLALVTLAVKSWVEWRYREELARDHRAG